LNYNRVFIRVEKSYSCGTLHNKTLKSGEYLNQAMSRHGRQKLPRDNSGVGEGGKILIGWEESIWCCDRVRDLEGCYLGFIRDILGSY
jgi:hypothetical protein